MKFDRRLWSLDYILEAMLAFAVPKEPRSTPERIVFISILIAFMIFSSSLFAIFMDTKIMMGTLMVIDTLEKLNGSTLTPMLRQNYFDLLSYDTGIVTQDLLKKSLIVPDDECVRILIKHTNVTCFFKQTMAMLFIQKYRDADKYPQLKIVDEVIHLLPQNMLIEPASPFLNRFNRIIIDLLESGILSYWDEPSGNHEK